MLRISLQFFGGRGASSGGGRQGSAKGLKESDILSTTSLISEREGQQVAVDEVLTVSQDFLNEFGVTADDWLVAEIDPSAGALAYADHYGTIGINKSYFGDGKMNNVYAETVASGFHPSNGNKTALQAVTAHEMGHRLNGVIATKTGGNFDAVATNIVNDARKSTKHRGVVQMASKISKYATYSNAEAIAEAVSDYYCNGKKAKAESRAIVGAIKKYLK